MMSYTCIKNKLNIQKALLLILVITTKIGTSVQDIIHEGNTFMDDLIEKIKNDRTTVYALDPLVVPDIKSDNFETNHLIVKGLSNMYRVGSCSVTENGFADVKCKMAADDLFVDFNYKAKALFVWFSGEGSVKVDQLLVELEISFASNKATLKRLEIVKLEDFHVKKMNGLSVLLNWMLRYIAESVFNRAKDQIKTAVRGTTSKALNDIIR